MDRHFAYRLIKNWKLNESIEKARRERNISRSQLAAKLDLTLGGVSAWEYGRTRPDLENIRRRCCALGVSGNELLGIRCAADTLSAPQKKLLEIVAGLPEKECSYLLALAETMLGVQLDANVIEFNSIKSRAKLISLPVNPLSM